MLDLNRYGIRFPKLVNLQAEVANLQGERARAERQVVATRGAIEAAKEQDAVASAKAIRSGERVPEPANEEKAAKALEAAERNLNAYAKAVEAAQSDLGAYMARNREKIYAAVREALSEKARRLAEHAREAAVLYGELEDARYDLRNLEPPQEAEEYTGPPQRLTTSFLGFQTTRQAGPDRGSVEAMLGSLASLEESFAAQEEGTPDEAA